MTLLKQHQAEGDKHANAAGRLRCVAGDIPQSHLDVAAVAQTMHIFSFMQQLQELTVSIQCADRAMTSRLLYLGCLALVL